MQITVFFIVSVEKNISGKKTFSAWNYLSFCSLRNTYNECFEQGVHGIVEQVSLPLKDVEGDRHGRSVLKSFNPAVSDPTR